MDLWWSRKHDNRGGNVQVISVPDGWPIWTSQVRPGREHDTTAVRAHSEILPTQIEAASNEQQQLNKAHNSLRAIGGPTRLR